jgi:hypothetical protein
MSGHCNIKSCTSSSHLGFRLITWLILFLPDNDLTDNDADYWSRFRPDYAERYRPYYQAVDGAGYRPFYPVPNPLDAPRDVATAWQEAWLTDAVRLLRRNSWSLAVYRFMSARHRPRSYSGYFDFTAQELQAVLWSFRKIKAVAGDRRMTIAVVPRPNDFSRVDQSGDSPLLEILNEFGRENDIEIVDLLQAMPRLQPRTERYYLSCDGHWNAEGNAVAAEAVSSAIQLGQRAPSAY